VRALTRVADESNEEELLELARHMTASQLERAVRAYRRVTRDDANRLQAEAYVGYTWDEDGALVVRARLAPEDGALFLRALEAARDRLQDCEWSEECGSAEPRRTKNAEALVVMADMALGDENAGRSGGERYQVVVHVDADGGTCALDDGPALSGETARRLACDASLVEITERDGEPLLVGRKTRTIPPAMRRALQARDQRCRFPGCDNRRFLETKLDNLVLLCTRHHRFVHEAGYSVVELADGNVEFRDPWGGPIPCIPRPPPGDAGLLLERKGFLEIDAGTCESGDADPMDLGLVVNALLARPRPLLA
jgi:Domain of unknown function (DUF222)